MTLNDMLKCLIDISQTNDSFVYFMNESVFHSDCVCKMTSLLLIEETG